MGFDDLSEQHIVDCALNHYYHDSEGSWGAFGCDGAWPPAYMDWLVNNNQGKIQTETSYPYTAKVGNCRPASNGDFAYGSVTCQYNLNHEVTIVGYGNQGGIDYWLVKNSWATWFGENGYFKIKRGTGHCGVGSLHYTSAYCAA